MCESFRIPHSHYLGDELRWTQLDREKAEAYRAWRARHCPRCDTRPEEWDPKRGGHRHRYVGSSERCVGCEVLDMEREMVPDEAKGIKVGLVPNPDLLDVWGELS